MDKQETQIIRVMAEPLPPTIKELSRYIWNKLGEVEITKESDIESGDPIMPVMNAIIRKVLVQTIRSCAEFTESHKSLSSEMTAKLLVMKAEQLEKMRYHMAPIGVPSEEA